MTHPNNMTTAELQDSLPKIALFVASSYLRLAQVMAMSADKQEIATNCRRAADKYTGIAEVFSPTYKHPADLEDNTHAFDYERLHIQVAGQLMTGVERCCTRLDGRDANLSEYIRGAEFDTGRLESDLTNIRKELAGMNRGFSIVDRYLSLFTSENEINVDF